MSAPRPDRLAATPAEALADLADGVTVMISGFGGAGIPHALLSELDRTGATELTVVIDSLRHLDACAPGLFPARRVTRAVCSAARGRGREPAEYELQWTSGELAVEMVPQGTFAERIRAGGAGIPAFYTPTGVGTMLAEGKEVRSFDGRAHVLEHALRADFALMRAACADAHGNVVFRGTQANFGPAMAAAATTTVVEVSALSPEPLDPHRIDIPAVYVQRIVVVP